jgi:hypothetical protein
VLSIGTVGPILQNLRWWGRSYAPNSWLWELAYEGERSLQQVEDKTSLFRVTSVAVTSRLKTQHIYIFFGLFISVLRHRVSILYCNPISRLQIDLATVICSSSSKCKMFLKFTSPNFRNRLCNKRLILLISFFLKQTIA